ncbi:hypothetical protein MASR1M29_08990 [Cloacibacterium normanense]
MTKTLNDISNLNEYLNLIEQLLNKIGYKDVKIEYTKKLEIGIIAYEESNLLKTTKFKMFVVLSELNGKLQMLKDVIGENIREDEVIHIVSSSNKISEYFKNWIKGEFISNKFEFWNDENVLQLINDYYIEYWDNKDVLLKLFEDKFTNSPDKQTDLSKYLNLDKKYKDYLDIFIEPKVFINKENHGRKNRVKINIKKIVDDEKNYIISGDAGTGKTTYLKEIGNDFVKNNKDKTKKILPIFLKANNIAENNYSILESIENYILEINSQINEIFEQYSIVVLIDSIDEFDIEIRDKLVDELNVLNEKKIRYILATRNSQNLIKESIIDNYQIASLHNFDLNQVRSYISNFFKHDLHKSEELWQNLKENNVLEKIPTTPLTLSLISILFEEKGFEIPATLTDIYDNFNTLLIGRLSVKSNLDFLTVTVKEKILSLYAFSIIKKPNRERLKKDDFISFANDYFTEQGNSVDSSQIPDLIVSLTDGTGVLFIDENGLVNFNHDHFLEYYASREIFLSEKRTLYEEEIIEKFIEYNWQNVAIFYTGRTKDMENFLSKLLKRVDSYKYIHEYLLSISGLGYVLQSLWLTKSSKRKDGIIKALDLLLKVDFEIKNMSIKGENFFRGINENVIALLNLSWFYQNFNSISLTDPLKLAFNDIHINLKKAEGTLYKKNYLSEMYKLFCIATVLQHGRIGSNEQIEILFQEDKILTYPLFVFLFDNALNLFEIHNKESLKLDYKLDSRINRYSQNISYYLTNDTTKTFFTDNEQLTIPRKVHLITEGRSDSLIINHAFLVLTEKSEPYWNIESVETKLGKKSGGAHELSKYLFFLSQNIKTEYDAENIVIGIFDNDSKGFQEFNGLSSDFELVSPIVKKHKDFLLYAILLPIPDQELYQNYHQERQNLKFFEIEHYLPLKLLQDSNMLIDVPIEGVYEIKDKKTDFANKVNLIFDVETFETFRFLFDEIDIICKKSINYCC